MSTIKHKLGREAFSAAFEYAYGKVGKDREEGIRDLYRLAEKYVDKSKMGYGYERIERAILDENGLFMNYMDRAMAQLDKKIVKTWALNLGYEAMFYGSTLRRELGSQLLKERPWINLRGNMGRDEMENAIEMAKEKGIFLFFLFPEELSLKGEDLIGICEANDRCGFIAIVEGAYIDESFRDEVKRVRNIALAVKTRDINDLDLVATLEGLKKQGLLYGTYIEYDRDNYYIGVMDEFIKREIERGVMFSLFEQKGELEPDQLNYLLNRISRIRDMENPEGLFLMDMENDSLSI